MGSLAFRCELLTVCSSLTYILTFEKIHKTHVCSEIKDFHKFHNFTNESDALFVTLTFHSSINETGTSNRSDNVMLTLDINVKKSHF